MPIVARSLAEYLGRICVFNGIDLVSVPGNREDLPLEQVVLFAREFAELNPEESEWSEGPPAPSCEEHPLGHPQGHFHWDKSRKQLLPIQKAGNVQRITLELPTQHDIESIADAGCCQRLMLVTAPVLDLSPLARLRTLAELYVYDVTEVDASPLAKCKRLRDVCFLRCHVRGIVPLASSGSLTRLRLNECKFAEDELDAVRRGRPDIEIERS
jgi:hypothetical protein